MELLKIKITNIGNKGDPFGRDEGGKVVFIHGNQSLKKGDLVECKIVLPVILEKGYRIAEFSKIITEGPMIKSEEMRLKEKLARLKEYFPIEKVWNSNSRRHILENDSARNLVHYILDCDEGPAPAKYDYPDFCHAFLSLRAAGMLAMLPPDKWCFSGEDFVKVNCKSASIEFVRRDDIRAPIREFLDYKLRKEFDRISRRR